MATINQGLPTLLDWARRTDPNGRIAHTGVYFDILGDQLHDLVPDRLQALLGKEAGEVVGKADRGGGFFLRSVHPHRQLPT